MVIVLVEVANIGRTNIVYKLNLWRKVTSQVGLLKRVCKKNIELNTKRLVHS